MAGGDVEFLGLGGGIQRELGIAGREGDAGFHEAGTSSEDAKALRGGGAGGAASGLDAGGEVGGGITGFGLGQVEARIARGGGKVAKLLNGRKGATGLAGLRLRGGEAET